METPRTVLLIDGDEDSLRIFAAILEHNGFRVLSARDDDAGLRHVMGDRPDLIVCDPFTLRLHGEHLAARLREDRGSAAIPVLVLSSVPYQASRIGLAAAALLEKPCKPERLLRAVRYHLFPLWAGPV
jgi:DNA-binding response OmpR family regulator